MKQLSASKSGPPDVLQLADVPVPVPGEGQALIRVAYATLNPLDVLIRQGRAQWMAGKWPFVPGVEYSGRVEAVGPGVDRAWVGQAVINFSEFGGCAEYALAPAGRLLPLEMKLGWKVATAWRTPTLAAWFLMTAAARPSRGEIVLLHSAAGPVGIMATQIARQLGARVVGLAGGPDKIAFARPYGADMLFDYRREDWVEQVSRYTAGAGVDVIVDGNGGPAAQLNHNVIARNGRLFYLGASSGTSPPPISAGLLIAKSFSVGGFNLNSIPQDLVTAATKALSERLARGEWRFPIGETVPLSGVAALHTRFESRQLAGRSLIEVGGEL